MTEKKLVIFTNNFPFGNGETFLNDEMCYLSSAFSEVHLFPLFYGNSQIPRELPDNVTYSEPLIHFDIKKDKLKLLLSGSFIFSPLRFSFTEFFSKKVFLNWKWLKNWMAETLIIRVILKKKNINLIREKLNNNYIIYFYWGDKSSGIVPYLKKIIQNKIVVRFHGSDLYEETKGGYIPYRKLLLRNIDYAIFISENGQEYLRQKYPDVNFRSAVHRLGVNRNSFQYGSSDNVFRIASCSNVVPVKRVNLILEAVNLLSGKIKWVHFGGGPLLNFIREQSEMLPSYIETNFPGHVSNQEIMEYYSTFPVDLFTNMSKSEGIPVSIMEAMSFGIPVLATNVGGVSEVIDNGAGILIQQDSDPKLISEKIMAFINLTDSEKIEMRKNAFEQWRKFYDAQKNFKTFCIFLKNINIQE